MTTMVISMESGGNSAPCNRQIRMTTGDGEDSYARNSLPQADYMGHLLPTMFEVIDRVSLPQQGVVVVADLGCATGLNGIRNVDAVINRIRARFPGTKGPEYQVYFQDSAGSDFNSLFQNLYSRPKLDAGGSVGEGGPIRPYFAAGVPGSFYGRLFPASSLHFVLSSFALHWLSKTPDAVLDQASPAYNGGHTELHLSSISTVDAFAEQAREDLTSFLAARALEMAKGGCMLLVFGLREGYYPYKVGATIELQERIWNDLVSEGLVKPESRDSHNNYVYFRTLGEVDEVLSAFSATFTVESRDITASPLSSSFHQNPASSSEEIAHRIISVITGAGGDLLESHFGELSTRLFLQRYREALIEGFNNKTLIEDLPNSRKHLVLALTRK
ncbi:hypothetical protein R1flu_015386 [Riccia fluitans]|uniref:Uncharacterized protein n=1 Tax=Riccia fluitans TaxID=41844 RepID=A0ABD1YJM9_9MARC